METVTSGGMLVIPHAPDKDRTGLLQQFGELLHRGLAAPTLRSRSENRSRFVSGLGSSSQPVV